MEEMHEQRISTRDKEPRAAMNLEGQRRHQGSENGKRGHRGQMDRLELVLVWKGVVGPDGIQGGCQLGNRNPEDKTCLCNLAAQFSTQSW